MPISHESRFPLCQFCGKPELPPGIVLLTYGPMSESPYCQGHDERVCCPHCGSMVHVKMHPFRACEYFHRMYDTSAWLRYDEVMQQAETILKEARTDGKWEGAD